MVKKLFQLILLQGQRQTKVLFEEARKSHHPGVIEDPSQRRSMWSPGEPRAWLAPPSPQAFLLVLGPQRWRARRQRSLGSLPP